MQESPEAIVNTVTRTINGKEFRFARLSLRDQAMLLKDLRQQRKAEKLQNLQVSGVDKEQMYTELEAFDEQPPYGIPDFFKYVNSNAGQVDVHQRAYLKANPSAPLSDLDALILNDTESLHLAAEISGYGVRSSTPPASEVEVAAAPKPGDQGTLPLSA